MRTVTPRGVVPPRGVAFVRAIASLGHFIPGSFDPFCRLKVAKPGFLMHSIAEGDKMVLTRSRWGLWTGPAKRLDDGFGVSSVLMGEHRHRLVTESHPARRARREQTSFGMPPWGAQVGGISSISAASVRPAHGRPSACHQLNEQVADQT